MTTNFIYEIFNYLIPKNVDFKNLIEVANFHDCEYGTIFYNGQPIYSFQGENYYNKIQNHNIVKKLSNLGLDIKKAKVVVYNFDLARDYILPNFSVLKNQYSSYSELIQDISADILPIKALIIAEEKKHNNLLKFINVHDLDE